MLSDPKIIIRPAQPFAAIQLDVSRSELPQHAPQLIDEVGGWLGRQGVAPVGAPFFSHLRMYGESMLDMEAGFFTPRLLGGPGAHGDVARRALCHAALHRAV